MYVFCGVDVDFFKCERRDGEGDSRFINITVDGKRYQVYISPQGKSARFFGPKGEMT